MRVYVVLLEVALPDSEEIPDLAPSCGRGPWGWRERLAEADVFDDPSQTSEDEERKSGMQHGREGCVANQRQDSWVVTYLTSTVGTIHPIHLSGGGVAEGWLARGDRH
jgi:hypothetical protein